MNRQIFFIIIVTFFYAVDFSYCSAQENEWANLTKKYLKTRCDKKKLKFKGYKQIAEQYSHPELAIHSTIDMWNRKEKESLELVWWHQDHRSVRTAILALFYTQSKMTVSNAPSFENYLMKFSYKEKSKRTEELQYVIKNKDLLNKLITKALKCK